MQFRGLPMVQSRAMRPLIPRRVMARLPRLGLPTIGPLLLSYLLMSACAGMSGRTPVGEGPLGTVALERLTSRGSTAKYSSPLNAFQASHPAVLSTSLMSQVLGGLSVSGVDRPGRTAELTTYPLLSPEEVEFLAPLIVRAFAQAQPDQRVLFAVLDDGLGTQGSLYLHKRTLRLSLSRYRSSAAQADAWPPSLTLSFSPAQALVQTDTPQSWMNIEPEQPRVAIAIDALSQLAAPMPAPAGNKTSAAAGPTASAPLTEQRRLEQELQATKDVVVKQAEELQKLKEELESVRRQLVDKEAGAVKAKPKPAPRKPSPQP